MTQLRVALVGSGSMGLNHARTIAAGPDTELAFVVDPSEENGLPVAQEYGARWVSGLDQIGDVDAAVIAASTEHHYDLALPIIKARLPLLIEKPVCPSLAQSDEVVTASREAGTVLMCGLLERFNPAVVVAMKMVEQPLYIRAERHSPYAARIRTGVAWDLLVHDVDLVVRAFGGDHPERAEMQVGHFHPDSVAGAEDVVEASLRFASGGIASVSASRLGQRKVRSMVIQEIDRLIEVDLLRRGVTSYRHSSLAGDPGRDGFRQMTEMEVPEVIGAEPLASQLAHFVGLVRGEHDPDLERDSILPAHRVVDQVLATRG
ncbi:Gfo/Idh/MocA family oxidoreductase [Nocardioides sp. 616]|uniref:Gfo/Idh/MocA family protein n=1 Tax=Nocardioides sp. 616 TaxID=2268090 RepID=UPI000CE4E0FC|nr:Gfo/Idh/MocA family oxidoreductase [Nocardioides sp. 616]